MKPICFIKINAEKGRTCWYNENHLAEGRLRFDNLDEINRCLKCAKTEGKWKKNRKVRQNTISNQKEAKKSDNPLVKNEEVGLK